VLYEDNFSVSVGSEVAAIIADQGWRWLDAPVKRLGGLDVPAMPYAQPMEDFFMPNPEKVAQALRELAADAVALRGRFRADDLAGLELLLEAAQVVFELRSPAGASDFDHDLGAPVPRRVAKGDRSCLLRTAGEPRCVVPRLLDLDTPAVDRYRLPASRALRPREPAPDHGYARGECDRGRGRTPRAAERIHLRPSASCSRR
jgi:hypothetical protein